MGTRTELSEGQIKARAMPKNTPEECEARRKAMLRATDVKYRTTHIRINRNSPGYYTSYYEKHSDRIRVQHYAYRQFKKGEISRAQFEATKLRSSYKETEGHPFLTQPVATTVQFNIDFN